MFLFWITTIISTRSSGASLKADEPSGAIMSGVAFFLDPEQIHIQISSPTCRNSVVFSSCSVKAVIERNRGIAGQPAMRSERAILGAVIL